MNNMNNIIQNLIKLIREQEHTPSWSLGLKLAEECGEVCEQLNFDHGHLPQKSADCFEGAMGEGADVIITTLGVLVTHYPELSEQEIYNQLVDAIEHKSVKYEKILKLKNWEPRYFRAIRTVVGLFDNGQLMVETTPNCIRPKEYPEGVAGLHFNVMDGYGGWDKFFEEITEEEFNKDDEELDALIDTNLDLAFAHLDNVDPGNVSKHDN